MSHATTLPLAFDGETYEPEKDQPRLKSQLDAVKHLMRDGRPRTIPAIRSALYRTGIRATEQGISARLRDLRKERYGSHNIIRQRVSGGLFSYRIGQEGELEE